MDRRIVALGLASLLATTAACGDAAGPNSSGPRSIDGPATFASAKTGKGDQIATPKPSQCPGGAPRLVDGMPAAWTVLVWAAGDNNLEDAIVQDINEMERGHTGSPNVNLIVQLDRKSRPGAWRYLIGPDGDDETINSQLVAQSDEELDSGNWKNLASFAKWATVCYPAYEYGVVVEGHGGGWSPPQDQAGGQERSGRVRQPGDPARLIAPDDTDGTQMSIHDLQQALEQIRQATRHKDDPPWLNRLAFYGSDACLMQAMEVDYDLQDTANFIVGSSETEPGPGWPYYSVIDDLTTRPLYYAQSPHKLVEAIVDNYGRSYGSRGGQGSQDSITLAAVDTHHVYRMSKRIERITGLILELMDDIGPHLMAARDATPDYGGYEPYYPAAYIDAAAFFTNLRAELIDAGLMPASNTQWSGDERWRELRDEIDTLLTEFDHELIDDNTIGAAHEGASGVSIYFPNTTDHWMLSLDDYAKSPFGQDTGWYAMLEAALQ